MKKKIIFSVITFFITLFICFILGEVITRIFIKDTFVMDERNLTYRYDEELGWFPIANSDKKFQGSRLINVYHNKFGFRDIEQSLTNDKRIAFLGDSFVWGYDVEQSERFTDKLRDSLPDWDLINMGVSGYGSDQEFILLQGKFDIFKPDIVFLFLCENDWYDNQSSKNYGGYYKPYFTVEDENKLIKNGTPVKKSLNYYRLEHPVLFKSRLVQTLFRLIWPKNKLVNDPTVLIINEMKKYVENKGSKFVLVFIDKVNNEENCAFCEKYNIDHLFVNTNLRYKTHGSHWTPQGHDFVSEKIYEYLKRNELINKN